MPTWHDATTRCGDLGVLLPPRDQHSTDRNQPDDQRHPRLSRHPPVPSLSAPTEPVASDSRDRPCKTTTDDHRFDFHLGSTGRITAFRHLAGDLFGVAAGCDLHLVEEFGQGGIHDVGHGVAAMGAQPFDSLLGQRRQIGVERNLRIALAGLQRCASRLRPSRPGQQQCTRRTRRLARRSRRPSRIATGDGSRLPKRAHNQRGPDPRPLRLAATSHRPTLSVFSLAVVDTRCDSPTS